MITGLHAIIFSKDAEKDRVFFKDVLKFPNVDVGEGWLIFAAPPSEMSFHPSEFNNKHAVYLMCDNPLKQTVTYFTHFAEIAKSAPHYGSLVPSL